MVLCGQSRAVFSAAVVRISPKRGPCGAIDANPRRCCEELTQNHLFIDEELRRGSRGIKVVLMIPAFHKLVHLGERGSR